MTGLICLNKPEGMTSFSAVSRTRRILGVKKAGHAGTLDPMATGVLPIALGAATRFLQYLPTTPKRYTAELQLGVRTDTLDRTGTILESYPVTTGPVELEAALAAFRGEILQMPPMYSALKKDGVRLYDLARQGVSVEREPRPVTISRLELVDTLPDHCYRLEVECSSGTYVRSLIDDLGQALGCGAVMTALCRTAVGAFILEHAWTLEQLEADPEQGVLSLEEVLSSYPELNVTAAQATRFHNGGALDLVRVRIPAEQPDQTLLRVNGPEHQFLGLGRVDHAAGELAIERIFTGG